MLTRYTLRLRPDTPFHPDLSWSYRLYAAMLEQAPAIFGERSHRDGTTPVSQFLTVGEEGLIWRVTLLGEESRQALDPVLGACAQLQLKRDHVTLHVAERQREQIPDVDTLFALCAGGSGRHRLQFCTPAAFKSRGAYRILPTTRLLLHSLFQQWNGCFPDCPIEDEDGQGLETMADGLLCSRFALHDQAYCLKGNRIPGFVGSMTLENKLAGFHRELADALLVFAGYAGVGIKTALGMGGVIHRMLP